MSNHLPAALPCTAGNPLPAKDRKPEILVEDGDLDRVVEEIGNVLRGNFFLRGHNLVSIVPASDQNRHDPHSAPVARMRVMDKDKLGVEIARRACLQRRDARYPSGFRSIDPSTRLSGAVLASADTLGFRPLRAIASTPFVRPDGSLADQAGYDPVTGLYLDVPHGVLEGMSREPTRAEAEDAARALDGLVSTFPFVESADRAVALCAILTILQRPVLPTALMHVFDSPTPGTGKTKLAAVACSIGTGRRAAVMSVSANDEETNKRLDAMLLAGQPVLVLDNIEAPLGGDRLCSMLSEPHVSLRPLGVSEVASIPVTCTVLATGNNMRLKGDVTRRALIARLDARTERPELRRFDNDPVEDAMAQRWDYVRAALTIILAYHRAGCPMVARPLGNFEAWCRMVRDPLIWAGCDDATATMDRLREDDPVLGDLHALLEAWRAAFGETPKQTADVVLSASTDKGQLRDALLAVAEARGEVNRKRLGHYLKKHVDRVVGGLRIVEKGKRNGSAVWQVVRVD